MHKKLFLNFKIEWTKLLKFNWKLFWDILGKISCIGGVISLVVLIYSRINLSNRIDIVENKISGYTAESTLLNYFSLIESHNFSGAYNLLSDDFKSNHDFGAFSSRLSDIVGFEGLKITELPEKNTAIQKVFLVEFGMKKRGYIPIDTKRGMYVRYLNGKWEINANSVIYDKKWESTACDFYNFDFCK